MKRVLLLFFGVCLFLHKGVEAQITIPPLGPDSLEIIEKNSIYSSYARQRSYEEALPSWRYVIQRAPHLSRNLYVNGVNIVKYMLLKTKDRAYLDTLMMVYDLRLEHFGHRDSEGYLLGRKGSDLVEFANGDTALLKEGFGYMIKSFEMEGDATEPRVLDLGLKTACQLATSEKLTRDEFIDLYIKFSEIADRQLADTTGGEEKMATYMFCRGNLDATLFGSGLADCDKLVEIMEEKFLANKDNLSEVRAIANILIRYECNDYPLYMEIVEYLYNQDPDADAAFRLALMFLRREDMQKAIFYIKETLNKSDDKNQQLTCYKYLAGISYTSKNYRATKEYAMDMLRIDPNSGEAYVFIGQAYAQSAEEFKGDDMGGRTVFWAAVDKLNRAKQLDSSLTVKVNSLIEICRANFPKKEDAFMFDIHDGDEITVGGWINEKTRARFN